jgi:hypothetical protein
MRAIARFAHSCVRSRLAWVLVYLHASWFLIAIANMSPPAPWLGEFLDRGGWSSATLFAGRPFHFHYESRVMKVSVSSRPSGHVDCDEGVIVSRKLSARIVQGFLW